MIRKISRNDEKYTVFFDEFLCKEAVSYTEHRKGSSFFETWIVKIEEAYHPDFPELWGLWETNCFVFDTHYGFDRNDVTELTRVERVEKEVMTKVVVYEYV